MAMVVAALAVLALLLAIALIACWRAHVTLRQLRNDEMMHGAIWGRLEQDLRDPMHTLTATSELLQGDLPVEKRALATTLRAAAHALMSGVNNAGLQLAPLPPASPSRVNVAELLRDLGAQPLFMATRRVHFEIHHEPGSPGEVEVAERPLRQILRNVIEHALAVTEQGHVEVTSHASGSHLMISVADTGPTMGQDVLLRLFEPYGLHGRLPGGNPGATGLNLSVAQRLARHLAGELTATPRPTGGTVIAVRLPVRVIGPIDMDAGGAPEASPFDYYARHRALLSPRHILVAEDQASSAHVIEATLERGGHTVVVVRDGDAALEELNGGAEYDAVVIDLRMPGTSGMDVMRLSRFGAAGGRDVPFIVLTGDSSERVRKECFAAGAWAFLGKPVSAQKLLESVFTVCQRAEFLATASVTPMAQSAIDLNAGSTIRSSVANGLAPPSVVDNMRDILRYAGEADDAASSGHWPAVHLRVRAIRGAAFLLGAIRVAAACRRAVDTPPNAMPNEWPVLRQELSESIDEAWRTLAALLAPRG